jgi:hypothetical protein
MAESVGHSPSRFEYPPMFSAICVGTAWLFQLSLLFQQFGSDFGLKQTPKTPNETARAVTKIRIVFQAIPRGKGTRGGFPWA